MKKMLLIIIVVIAGLIILDSCGGSMTAEEHATAYAENTDWESLCGVEVKSPQPANVNHSDFEHTYAMVEFDGGYIQFELNGAGASATECTLCTYEPRPEGKGYEINVDDLED
jgi:hypothetical protein